MTTVLQTFGFKEAVSYRLRNTPVEKTSRLYGVELEIEGCVNDPESYLVGGITHHNDGSLRNNGAEFVTRPMSVGVLSKTLMDFFEKNKFTDANYSERCSVHVHANVQDFTIENINALSLTYAVVEKVLFSYIGEDRDKNIFCVPWYDTAIVNSVASYKDLGTLAHTCSRKWQKYTAMNLHPMYSQGTVEFRHMGGTHNVNKILNWVGIIDRLMNFVKATDFQTVKETIIALNTTSAYYEFFRQVFGEFSHLLESTPFFMEMLEDGVICAKMALESE